MTLPNTLQMQPMETPVDLLARLAAVNAFPTLRDFLDHTEVTADRIVAGEPAAMEHVSLWSGIPTAKLVASALKSADSSTWSVGHALFNKEMRPGRRQRFCAACVLNDLETREGRTVGRAFRRAWWMSRGIQSCPEHGCLITEVAVSREHDLFDFPRFVEANLDLIRKAADIPSSSPQPRLDRYLFRRVTTAPGSSFADSLEAHVLHEFSMYLGRFMEVHDVVTDFDHECNLAERGFGIVAGGEQAVRAMICGVIDRVRPSAKKMHSFFTTMGAWLKRNVDRAGYRYLIDMLHDIAVSNIPLGETDSFIKPVLERRMYCVITAAGDYGLTLNRVREIMASVDPNFRDGLVNAQTYVKSSLLIPALEAARETITSIEAAKVMGVSEQRVWDLIWAGLIPVVEARNDGRRPYTRIARKDFDAFTDSLCARARLAAPSCKTLPLTEVARKWKRPLHDLILMILEGNLDVWLVNDQGPVVSRLRMAPEQLKMANMDLLGGTDDLKRPKEVEKHLGTTTATVNELIRRGFLIVRMDARTDTKRVVMFVERASLDQFEDGHLSLSSIVKSYGSHRKAIKAELDRLGIRPIFEPEGKVARFYKKADLAGTKFKAK